jgi:hypothetical protein
MINKNEQVYKGFVIARQYDSGEYWVYNPLYSMYKTPKFKKLSNAKKWIDNYRK